MGAWDMFLRKLNILMNTFLWTKCGGRSNPPIRKDYTSDWRVNTHTVGNIGLECEVMHSKRYHQSRGSQTGNWPTG